MSPNQSKASGVPHREAFANSLFMKRFFAAAVGGDCPRTVSADDFGQLGIGWYGHA
jgi:hypothetical protein